MCCEKHQVLHDKPVQYHGINYYCDFILNVVPIQGFQYFSLFTGSTFFLKCEHFA
jgi:hypothetical protein